MRTLLIYLFAIVLTGAVSAQKIEGHWNMIGMKSGKLRSTIEIYKVDDNYHGKVVKLYPAPGDEEAPICQKCKGDRQNDPVLGMDIIRDLEFDSTNQEFVNGKILDPASGAEYSCKAWIDRQGLLMIRGSVMFFTKTYILPPAQL